MSLPHLHLLPGLHGTPDLYAPLLATAPDWPHSTCAYPADLSATANSIVQAIADSVPVGTPYVLVAESFSGPFAVKFAAQRPAGLTAIVLVNTFLRIPMRPFVACTALVPVWHPWFLTRALLLNRVSNKEVVALCRRIIGDLSGSLIAARLRLLCTVDSRQAASSVAVPTLILRGTHDRLVWGQYSRVIARHLSHATVRQLPGPHLLLQSHPRECLEIIRQWSVA